jgi:hypothetical protein
LLIRQPGVSLSELAWSSRSEASFGIPARVSLSSVSAGYVDDSARSRYCESAEWAGRVRSGCSTSSAPDHDRWGRGCRRSSRTRAMSADAAGDDRGAICRCRPSRNPAL